jgi:hypothetical protein
MNRTVLGLLILGAVAAAAVAVSQFDLSELIRQTDRRDRIAVSIYYGGEKSALLANPAVKDIIDDRYKITLTASRAGSVEQATTLDITGRDCLWPSNEVAVELARNAGRPVIAATTIFNSPIVFYAWAEVADAMAAKGMVTKRNDGLLTADIAAISAAVDTGARWKEDLGLNIYGPFRIFSTHPAKSNSGNVWSGLLAITFNNGTPPTATQIDAILPRLTAYFATMGHMEASSGDIFENFLKQGMGARPIIVGYENQLVEFLTVNANYADLIKSRIRVIYPEPTVFASHPLISLTPACARLAEALQDAELQQIAWAEHGFRTGLIGVENDPAAMTAATLPATVDLVVPMPPAAVMEKIIAAVE